MKGVSNPKLDCTENVDGNNRRSLILFTSTCMYLVIVDFMDTPTVITVESSSPQGCGKGGLQFKNLKTGLDLATLAI